MEHRTGKIHEWQKEEPRQEKMRAKKAPLRHEQREKPKQQFKYFFGNITSASEKAITYIIERNDDVVLLAEHHLHREGTLKLMNLLQKHKWRSTASPARPTERSEKGTTAGVLVAVKKNVDNRPVSFALDAEGRLTGNA